MRKSFLQLTLLLRRSLVVFAAVSATAVFASQPVVVDPANAVIVLKNPDDIIKKTAAQELALHLKLITGQAVPVASAAPAGKYPFFVGACAPGTRSVLAPEQGSYTITSEGTWIYGDDHFYRSLIRSRTGTMHAVYNFLENELGVHWIEPGDKGIVFHPERILKLKSGSHSWIPELSLRQIRIGGYAKMPVTPAMPAEFILPEAEREKKTSDAVLWGKRLRLGRSDINLHYSHAFTKWWKLYGKKHPEYFALNKYGKREPENPARDSRVKLCVSNPEVAARVAENWLKSRGDAITVNTCENDSAGYCRCPGCRALDVAAPGEGFGEFLTDRYLWFSNQVQRLVRKQVPEAKAIMYAYSVYRFPPRKVKVDPGMIIGFVPKIFTTREELVKYYQAWYDAGARNNFLRPNDMHIDVGLPMGFEQRMFDGFKIARQYGLFGADFDSIHHYWPTSGIGNYILARGFSDPAKPFEFWENEYCSFFGDAAAEVKSYFRYWRNEIWEKRLMPDREVILKRGRYGNFRRGMSWRLEHYYKPADFDVTDALLKKAAERKLAPAERERLETLILANRHGRLMFEAIKAKNARPGNMKKLRKAASALREFRLKYRRRLSYDWERLFYLEQAMGDTCGMKAAGAFGDLEPVVEFNDSWFFKLDPGNEGIRKQYWNYSYSRIRSTWDVLGTSATWESAPKAHPELAKLLKNYDGIGWYAQKITVPAELKDKKIYVWFGAVDESCWLYINGKPAGERLFTKADDWKTPFKIRIDHLIDWQKPDTVVVVRVEDKLGGGGIWQPVWLVTEK